MNEMISIISVLVGVGAAFISFLLQLLIRRQKELEAKQRELYAELWNRYHAKLQSELQNEPYLSLFLTDTEKALRNFFVHVPAYLTKVEIESEVNKKFDELKSRVEEIEKRFPKDATLEKIASVNDAILATNLEALSETVKRIEQKLLGKWDVAKVVFQILAALGVLIGIIFAIKDMLYDPHC
jgi:hypothetical protein